MIGQVFADSKMIRIFLLLLGVIASVAWADDNPSLAELHPPVVASLGQQKVSVFFLKNNLKNSLKDSRLPSAEIFYSPLNFAAPSLNYVWKIEGEQILSVFFYEWKSKDRIGKSMYVLTKSRLSNNSFEGFTYSAMELPIIKDGEMISIAFFPQDAADPALENCNEGRDLKNNTVKTCDYKDANSIKKYLAAHDR